MQPASGITVREATAADIPAIRDLSSRIWREHYPGIISREQIDYMLERMYGAPVIAGEMASKGYRYVLVLAGTVPVGYLSFRRKENGRTVLISKLYLLPALHGRGIGRMMLAYVRDEALRSGARTICLFVNRNNRKAIRAYERFGFAKAAEVATDIGGGFVMDDYRMELSLTPDGIQRAPAMGA